MNDIHVNDIGTALDLTITESGAAVDVSGVGAAQIKLRSPEGRVLTKTATFVTDGTDGKVRYTTQSGDLSAPGTWRWQGYLQNLGGWTGHTSEGQPFEVRQNVG